MYHNFSTWDLITQKKPDTNQLKWQRLVDVVLSSQGQNTCGKVSDQKGGQEWVVDLVTLITTKFIGELWSYPLQFYQ